jgi:16S rRNA (cytosine967-C5)-methyltransferase
MARLAPRGRIVYSTCSLEREENEAVIAAAAGDGFHVVDCREELEQLRLSGKLAWGDSLISGQYLRTIPGVHPCDGFFAAIVKRVS